MPLQDPDLAVSELEYCVQKIGLRGVEINPNVNRMDLQDLQKLMPLKGKKR